jgi:hypothetical protein
MTRLEELKAAYSADLDAEIACDSSDAAACAAARDAGDASWAAYEAELKKIQEENSE